jgi:hypothetical protein
MNISGSFYSGYLYVTVIGISGSKLCLIGHLSAALSNLVRAHPESLDRHYKVSYAEIGDFSQD